MKAAQALKLPVCGVDMLQSARGPLLLEVNSTPGLEGIETATGKNIAKTIITYIEKNIKINRCTQRHFNILGETIKPGKVQKLILMLPNYTQQHL